MKTKYYSLQSFLSYLGRYKLRVAVVFVCFMIANVSLAIIPLFVGKLIGSLAAHQTGDVGNYVIILIACSTIHDLVWHSGELSYLKLFYPIAFDYETMVFQQVIRKPYPYFVDKFTGKISSYITQLGTEFREGLEKVFWDYAQRIVDLITVSTILLILNWQSGLIFVSCLVLMFGIGRKTVKNSMLYEKRWTDVQSTKNAKIIDAIANFVNVKSFQKEAREGQRIEHEQAMNAKSAGTSFIWAVVFWGSMGLIVRNLLWPSAVILNVYMYQHGQISLAEFTTFLTSVLLFTNYVWDIIWDISQFTLKLARVEEAYLYLYGPTNITDEFRAHIETASQPPPFTQSLKLNHLHFSYPDDPDRQTLKDISLDIKKGEKLGIVGKSGSGKTTLTKLLLGYYDVADGEIMLDGQTIETKTLARLVSYVPQDTSLFHRTIAENIAYASDHVVGRDEIVNAAKQAHADEFIELIDKGYEALVGERGVKLSAGQRQRIAIARAFLDDKPLLILDEATSALDSESELLVQEALEALWQEKTVIAIAHRLSTLRHMDRIIVIDNGKIAEEGNHQALIAKKGHYAKLWSHQSGGFLHEDHED